VRAGVRAAPRTAPRAAPSVRVQAPEGTETAWFRLDDPGAVPDPERSPVGLARWVSGPLDPDAPGDGRRVELELRWIGEDVRLLIAERVLPSEHRVVWREQLTSGGRTVLVSVDRTDPTADLRVTETASGEIRRRALPRDRGAWQLLSLVEAACRGVEPRGAARILMPQKAQIETVRLALEAVEGDRRRLSLTFADGLQGPRFTFAGRELVGFTWQAGGPLATRIPAEQHSRWIRFAAGDQTHR